VGNPDGPGPIWLAALGERVRILREAHGLGQAELAKSCGLARTSITNLESGRQEPPVRKLALIADALGVTVGALLGETAMPALPMVRVRLSVVCDEHGEVKAGLTDPAEAEQIRTEHARSHLDGGVSRGR
jgi:transcriptional regulator with XRE-family HTH domain